MVHPKISAAGALVNIVGPDIRASKVRRFCPENQGALRQRAAFPGLSIVFLRRYVQINIQNRPSVDASFAASDKEMLIHYHALDGKACILWRIEQQHQGWVRFRNEMKRRKAPD